MIDLHCHILPGIDDGARDWDEAMAMARCAVEDGIHTLAATPHVHDRDISASRVRVLVREFNSRLKDEGCPLTVLAGGEVHWDVALELADDFQIGRAGLVLVEFPHTHLPGDAIHVVRELRARGLRPLVAHPERNPDVAARPDLLRRLLDAGAAAQVTADSLTGRWGGMAQECAWHLLEQGWVSCLGSDAHSSEFRPPELGPAVDVAARLVGIGPARDLVLASPGALLGLDREPT